MMLTGLAITLAGPATAQQPASPPAIGFEPGKVLSPILVIDTEGMWRDSAFGRRARADHEARLTALETENESVAAALEAEEEAIAAKRGTVEAQEFTKLADSFDRKVADTRNAQLARNQELLAQFNAEREAFLVALRPVMEQLLRESDAIVILERPQVVYNIPQVDITERAIALMDETIGAGDGAD